MQLFHIHYWGAFWTVVCLGMVQIMLTYLSSNLAIDALPSHIPYRRRQRHRSAFAALLIGFVSLTLVLAKLNDANQYKAETVAQQERTKQDFLRTQLVQTLAAINMSQTEISVIRRSLTEEKSGEKRSAMLGTLETIQQRLQRQSTSMEAAALPRE